MRQCATTMGQETSVPNCTCDGEMQVTAMADPTRKKSWKRRHPVLTLALLPAIITWTTIRISLKVTAWSVRTTHNLNKRRRQRKRAKRQQAIDRQRKIEWEAQQWRNLQRQLQIQQQRQAKLQAQQQKQSRQRWLKCRRPPPPPPPPPPTMYCSAQSLEQSRECVLDPASSTATTAPSATTPVTTATQPMEQPGECLFDPPPTTSPSSPSATSPVAPVTTVESLQSALASSHTTPDSIAPTIAPALSPALSSSTLPTLTSQQPLTPSSSTSIPRPLPLGTTMIVQGLVQTIEVSRIPARNSNAPATHEEPNSAEETRPLLDKGKGKEEAGENKNVEVSGPLASGSSPRATSTPILNTSASDSNTPDTLTDTPASPTMTSIDAPTTPNDIPNETTTSPTTSRAPSPSSTDVLGLLLSIAAQATAEALVPCLRAITPAPTHNPTSYTASTDKSRASVCPKTVFEIVAFSWEDILPLIKKDLIAYPRPKVRNRATGVQSHTVPQPNKSYPPTRLFSTRTDSTTRRTRQNRTMGSKTTKTRTRSGPLDESVDFGRAPPTSTLLMPTTALPESSVSPLPSPSLPVEASTISIPAPVPGSPMSEHTSSIPVPTPTIPVPAPSNIPFSTPSGIPVPTPSRIPVSTPVHATPTTDAEELIRFSQMLGFTPGVVHPPGTFERFLADMQDELRVTLGEYQERVRVRGAEGGSGVGAGGNVVGDATSEGGDATGGAEGDGDRTRLDHTRPHVPSTDPLPLNWWRMYRFPALPDGGASSSSATSTAPAETAATSPTGTTAASPAETTATSPTSTPAPTDAETQQPIHPAIIIGLRSISRDPTEETVPEPEGDRARSTENRDRVRSSERGDRVRSPDSRGRLRSFGSGDRVRRRLRLGDEEERRTRDGTRNYIIWIIGGYYPSNHPLLAHPNLFLGHVHPDELWMLNEFLGQVKPPTVSRDDIAKAGLLHPDELWMLNEFLGQVKPPTVSRDDIAKAGLRIVKGTEVKELAETKAVTENCTERCLICLDDYADDEDLRIMNCKHMFHKDCVDRWMETGRNNCPACRTKGVETTPAQESTPVS
ncbi:unnamed protein product [Rhizoctonia solani]|uniref:RING-type E3 ubiquitin transferase n=1 Tax=Rhizoctonia solani TaxID=456999 RepID=A0A8H3HF35_9AGAM|nr:unnamed protein product [Rhizoctonia solani]